MGLTHRTFLSLSPQAWRDLGLGLLPGLRALAPWRYALKRIGGQFGSSVLSYFLFLKTLLAFNILLLLPLLAFIVAVQAAFPPAGSGPVRAFTGLELLTGGVRPGAPSCPGLPGETPFLPRAEPVSSPGALMSMGPQEGQGPLSTCVVLTAPALALPHGCPLCPS